MKGWDACRSEMDSVTFQRYISMGQELGKAQKDLQSLREELEAIRDSEDDCNNCEHCAPCGWGTKLLKGYAQAALTKVFGDNL